ncbi:hypothetical protein L6452_19240 [Arctium lappa]|uniref:Uncharacterized protein n=1 Tax=Arctium lappa TaxID=4217 RepID=A0ACB9B8W0_ARCLA|nr:hypothetical protein L6452_19240 [Arctium lappa]
MEKAGVKKFPSDEMIQEKSTMEVLTTSEVRKDALEKMKLLRVVATSLTHAATKNYLCHKPSSNYSSQSWPINHYIRNSRKSNPGHSFICVFDLTFVEASRDNVAHFDERDLLWSTIMERQKMEMMDAFMKREVLLLAHMEKQEECLQKIMRANDAKKAGQTKRRCGRTIWKEEKPEEAAKRKHHLLLLRMTGLYSYT